MIEPFRLLEGASGLVLGVSGPKSIGFRCAEAFRSGGARVAVSYRAARRDACAALADRAGFPRHYAIDVEDPASFERAFADLDETFGRLDFLLHTWVTVPSAGLATPLLDLTDRDLGRVVQVGVHSLLAACRHALPLLERSAAPRVVALSSPGARRALPSYAPVGIAKAALEATVRYLALELGPRGILCNLVSFSVVETEGLVRAIGAEPAAAARAHLAKRAPTRTPVSADDVARAVAFLSSPACTNVTGETFTVDGGFSHLYA